MLPLPQIQGLQLCEIQRQGVATDHRVVLFGSTALLRSTTTGSTVTQNEKCIHRRGEVDTCSDK